MSKEFVLIKVGADLPGKAKAGDVVQVPVNKHGTIQEHYWRRRMRDAETERLRDPEHVKKYDEGECETCVRVMTDQEVAYLTALVEANEKAAAKLAEEVTKKSDSEKQPPGKGNKKSGAKASAKE